jgi:hypothetical protein
MARVKQTVKQMRDKRRRKLSGNEWIWTTDQGLMSPLLCH